MLKPPSCALTIKSNRRRMLFAAALSALALSLNGCHFFQPSEKNTITTSDGKKINVNDRTVQQYLSEWSESKDSIERLANMEGDLTFLLNEVSKMSDLGQTPGQTKSFSGPTPAPMTKAMLAPNTLASSSATTSQLSPTTPSMVSAPAVLAAPVPSVAPTVSSPVGSTTTSTSTQTVVPVPATTSSGTVAEAALVDINMQNAFCPENFSNGYKKIVAFSNFPRMHIASSKLGALHQVEQHLPMLIGANLRTRHQMLTPLQINGSLARANQHGDLLSAQQAQALAKQHRVQFVVSGEVDDMSMSFPNTVEKPSYYTRFISGAHNLLHINTPLDKRSRVFSFTLEARDGFTGELVFSNQYRTFGKWKAIPGDNVGFGTPQFWQTDYGIQVQQLVGKASNELAGALHCQPYMARVDSSPYQQQVVIHSGSNSGLRSGDALDLYQMVYQAVPGEYQKFDTRLVKHTGRVYLTEIYPSHSVGQVVNETLSAGQYVVKAQ